MGRGAVVDVLAGAGSGPLRPVLVGAGDFARATAHLLRDAGGTRLSEPDLAMVGRASGLLAGLEG